MRLFELQRHYSWIVDRFHRSTLAYQETQGRHYDLGWLEERLAAVGFHVVLCTRRDGTWEGAREERLRVSGNPSQYDDLERFRSEQDRLRTLAAAGRLRVLELDTTDGDLESACVAVADWLAGTGGLWCGAS